MNYNPHFEKHIPRAKCKFLGTVWWPLQDMTAHHSAASFLAAAHQCCGNPAELPPPWTHHCVPHLLVLGCFLPTLASLTPHLQTISMANHLYCSKPNLCEVLFIWQHCESCWILVPWPGIEPVPPAVEAQSLNHWTTREIPRSIFLSISHLQSWSTPPWYLWTPYYPIL